MIGLLKSLFGNKKDKDVKLLQPFVHRVNEEFAKLNSISNDELRNHTVVLKKKIADFISVEENKIAELRKEAALDTTPLEEKESIYQEIEKLVKLVDEKIEVILLEILPEAFAIVKETAKRFKENNEISVTATAFDKDLSVSADFVRIEGDKAVWKNSWSAAGTTVVWDMVHYDVQLMGGVVLHQGKISEMQTGEGKTLVGTLPIYLNALAGKGVHIVTVNDYLAKRDSEWNGPIFQFHGLSVDCIDKHQPHSPGRFKAYRSDITYGTNNEFGFDYLRDNMSTNKEGLVQRKHHFAIVDEVDSVLIDDARTPLIISGPTPKGDKHEFFELKPKIERIVNEQKKYLNICLTDAKKMLASVNDEKPDQEKLKEGGIALLRAHRGLPKNKALIKFLSEPGMRAHMQKTENYYLADQQKEMPKIDKELYFVIDEKNNSIELTDRGIELLSQGEDPSYYIMPDIGTEISKIENAATSADEKIKRKDMLMRDYTIKAERIHSLNQLLKAYTLFENNVEYVIDNGKIKIVDEQTGRIMDGRRYSDGLHQAIEAKENVKIEASTQTYATITLQNYFRMYHKLAGMTGTAETEAKELWDIYKLDVVCVPTHRPMSRKDHHDMIYKTNREKYNAIIEDTIKMREAGRPVLVGTTSVENSELLSRMLKLRNIPHQVLNAKMHQKEAEVVAEAGKAGTVTIATNMAGRGTDIKLGTGVKEAGGLAIIGTERHESRRVDRQLRGRSGRQGDPGSSQFYVSLEDNLMRLFGSERIARMMDRLGLKEGEVIQHSMITKSIERAQKKVEENNFGIRKRLLEYDDVMNVQRKTIYSKRRNALFGEGIDIDIQNMFYDVAESIVNEFHSERLYDEFKFELIKNLSVESPVTENEFIDLAVEEIAQRIFDAAQEKYKRKSEEIGKAAWPIVKNVYETQAGQYENIVIPLSDGMKQLQMVVNLKETYQVEAKNVMRELEKRITLLVIDNEWKEHLREMDDLRQSVQHATYEQKDPLLIYKLESFELFRKMVDRVNKEVISFLIKSSLPLQTSEVRTAPTPKKEAPKLQESRKDNAITSPNEGVEHPMEKPKQQPIVAEKKVGRNDPCPCGSGKKFKNCHGTEA
jgi:preprotein translocase subunit SecA